MGQNLFLLTPDQPLVENLRDSLAGKYSLFAGRGLADLRSQRNALPLQGVLVHLCGQMVDANNVGGFVKELKQLTGNACLVALVAKDCPSRILQLAKRAVDYCTTLPLNMRELLDALRDERQIPQLLKPMYAQWPHRAIHGTTKSFVTFEPRMFSVLDDLSIAATHNVTILLTGETGTGKTHLSRVIHELSPLRDERFCTVACGALPPDLLESELFGHVKGAFTGAERDREGKFAAAGKGTLLLDEIDLLTFEQQAKLLRVIETGEYDPVGSNDTQVSQARVIVASNIPLEELVEAGSFRKDLFYRLNILRFELPPLRARPLDAEFLIRSFAVRYGREYDINLRELDAELLTLLKGYRWPGNIRELENVMRRAALYCRDGVLRVDHLPAALRNGNHTNGKKPRRVVREPGVTLAERKELSERQIIEESLNRNNHHRGMAAKELGISRVTLYHKMKKFGMLAS